MLGRSVKLLTRPINFVQERVMLRQTEQFLSQQQRQHLLTIRLILQSSGVQRNEQMIRNSF